MVLVINEPYPHAAAVRAASRPRGRSPAPPNHLVMDMGYPLPAGVGAFASGLRPAATHSMPASIAWFPSTKD
jgi:hypothetical protein